MFDVGIILMISVFGFSIVIMWQSMQGMLSVKSIESFLPFFLLGFILSFYTGALLFIFDFPFLGIIFHFGIFISLLWIFINIWRNNK